MSETGSLQDEVQLVETLGTAGVRSPQLRSEQGAIGPSTGSLTIGHECPEVVIVYSRRSEGGGGRRRTLGGIYQQRIPHTDKGAYQKHTARGLSLAEEDPGQSIHVTRLTNVSDGDIVNWSAGIAISPLSYYRCCDNDCRPPHPLVSIFTLAHRHKSSTRNIILKVPQQHRAFQARTWLRSEQEGALNY
ncbi:hypothetical protein CRG98_026625 [Punica granatum]|uniref:Uncharacterized protein n=1 Tax=Punica granatum TaxID=22663 RepID=A0A2I0J9V2_PUNGR|nr:hypothetical protein CRG98_026625 [Punica granatum]